MEVRKYKIDIKASPQKVWFSLWDNYHYLNWTSVFGEGTYVITDNWEEGSKVHFLNPEGKGMYSWVTENKPFERMVFTHIGDIDNYEELSLSEETNKWTGARERYDLSENNGVTTLVVTVDVYEKLMDFFDNVFPKGLRRVKEMAENFYITVQTTVTAPIEKVWEKWNDPKAITKWYVATDTWYTPTAENDLRRGGLFKFRMEAREESTGFDFAGIYSEIETNKCIKYSIEDGRKVKITFETRGDEVKIIESFEPETHNPFEMQRNGWQAILDNFKKFTENE